MPSRARGEFVVGELAFAQYQLDAGLGALRVGEIVLERRADEFVAGTPGELLHLLVHVGDDAARVGGDQGVDVRFDQRAGVELLVADALVEQHALGFHLLAGGVVRPDQQVPDDSPLRVAQGRDRHVGRESAAVLADVGQFVDVLDPPRRLEHQRLEARGDRRPEFGAQGLGAGDHLLRVGDVGRGVLVHHLGGGVAQHALGPDVEDLDDALLVGGDAREVGAVENGVLQGAGLEQLFFRPLAGGHVFHGQDQQLAVVAGLELAGVEQHHPAADHRERVVEFEVLEDGTFGNDVLEQRPQVRDVPLAVSQLVDEAAFGLPGGDVERLVKGAVGGLDTERGVEDEQRFPHRVHDVLGVVLNIFDERLWFHQKKGSRLVLNSGHSKSRPAMAVGNRGNTKRYRIKDFPKLYAIYVRVEIRLTPFRI